MNPPSPHIQRLRYESKWCSIKAVVCVVFAITTFVLFLLYHTSQYDMFLSGSLIAVLLAIAIGYAGDVRVLNERIRRMEHTRRTFHLERV